MDEILSFLFLSTCPSSHSFFVLCACVVLFLDLLLLLLLLCVVTVNVVVLHSFKPPPNFQKRNKVKMRAAFTLLSLMAAVYAQSTNENGPLFDPSNAPFFGPSGLVDPTTTVIAPIPTLTDNVPTFTQTPTFIRSRTSSAVSQTVSSYASSQSNSSSQSRSTAASASTSTSTSASASTSLSRSVTSSAASASAPTQSTGAAVANGQNMVGVIVGGVVAGLALL